MFSSIATTVAIDRWDYLESCGEVNHSAPTMGDEVFFCIASGNSMHTNQQLSVFHGGMGMSKTGWWASLMAVLSLSLVTLPAYADNNRAVTGAVIGGALGLAAGGACGVR